jgi:hypothetical protein
MIVVMLVACSFAAVSFAERSARYKELAFGYNFYVCDIRQYGMRPNDTPEHRARAMSQFWYYLGLKTKYERAARFPWLPVAPDPPPPWKP